MSDSNSKSADGELQISEDTSYSRGFWFIERVSWLVVVVLIVLAALGLVGEPGPLNEASARSGSMSAEYRPIVRRMTANDINVSLYSVSGDTARLSVERGLLDEYQIDRITPEPSEVVTDADRFIYGFDTPSGASDLHVRFDLRPERLSVGTISGDISSGGDTIKIKQVVLP